MPEQGTALGTPMVRELGGRRLLHPCQAGDVHDLKLWAPSGMRATTLSTSRCVQQLEAPFRLQQRKIPPECWWDPGEIHEALLGQCQRWAGRDVW